MNQIDHKGGGTWNWSAGISPTCMINFLKKISQSEMAMTRMIAELEVKFDKLELEVTKMVAGAGGKYATDFGQHGGFRGK